jgi:signal transduction histidine kinase
VESRSPLIIDDVTQDSRWKQQPWLPVNKSWLGVPIVAKGKVIGMVSLTRKEPRAFSRDDATYVQSFALQAAVALENAKLYNDIARFNEQLEQMVMDRTEELNDAYQTLEKLDKAKSNFISIAAHELRTPLTVVNAYAQMLRQFIQPPHPPTTQRAIDGIISGSERLHEIVNSMLDIARIDNELINISQTRINVAEIVDYVQANFAEALQARKLTLHTDGLDQLPPLQADRELLYKVFYHLLNNAIKYTPDGGAITISGRVAEDAATSAPRVELCVCDTGIGIDPEQQELIFEKFYQTGEVAFHSSGRTKFKGGGPGLGLSIVRGIVTAHGGRIWVESDGQDEQRCPGASFYIRLPIEQDQGGRVEPTGGRGQRALANASM